MRIALTFLCLLYLTCHASLANDRVDDFFDELSQHLSVSTADDNIRARLSGAIDFEYHKFSDYPPSLIDTTDSSVFQPRTSLFLDVQAGPKIYLFSQARIDRGFDPSDNALEARLDEYFIRVTPWENGRLNLQAGKYATIVGQWSKRHLSWTNPFISAPLFYEHATRLSDKPFEYSKFPVAYIHKEDSYGYNPIVWGPSYATGAAAAGKIADFEWAIDVKNASLMSRPDYWTIDALDFEYPTVSARLQWKPDLRWSAGLSFSDGTYLGPQVRTNAPFGFKIGKHHQKTTLLDFTYEWHALQIWTEILYSEFNGPLDSIARSNAYFIESKYKLTPRFHAAVRWNQQFFNEIERSGKPSRKWGENKDRIDVSTTWRLNAHSQVQVEYNYNLNSSSATPTGNRIASKFTLRF